MAILCVCMRAANLSRFAIVVYSISRASSISSTHPQVFAASTSLRIWRAAIVFVCETAAMSRVFSLSKTVAICIVFYFHLAASFFGCRNRGGKKSHLYASSSYSRLCLPGSMAIAHVCASVANLLRFAIVVYSISISSTHPQVFCCFCVCTTAAILLVQNDCYSATTCHGSIWRPFWLC